MVGAKELESDALGGAWVRWTRFPNSWGWSILALLIRKGGRRFPPLFLFGLTLAINFGRQLRDGLGNLADSLQMQLEFNFCLTSEEAITSTSFLLGQLALWASFSFLAIHERGKFFSFSWILEDWSKLARWRRAHNHHLPSLFFFSPNLWLSHQRFLPWFHHS